MPANRSVVSKDIFRFLRDLARHNNKPWMDANRERYRAELVEPFRALLDCFAPAARKLNPRFSVSGRVGVNFSRINRDIRFAKDKTPYRPQMYLFFTEGDGEAGQLYIGAAADSVTCGFRIYGHKRVAPLVRFGRPRGAEQSSWIERQRTKLGRGYESYWYSTVKGEWTKTAGWPTKSGDWKKLQGWIVRKKLAPSAATRSAFYAEACKIFRETYPLCRFAGSPDWKE
ncbi:MAG TPA: DUF2461 family protein [Candidatus Acidoferrales bacterium]